MEQNKKQTAVDWLVDKLLDHLDLLSIEEYGLISVVIDDLSDQAKEMEKEQLKESWDVSCNEMHKSFSSDVYKRLLFNQYYKETYETNSNS